MPITAQFLKGVMTEARPIIERQMDDAKLIAGFRTVVANNGGDWGALKALIKAHIEDQNDETGDGKRVQKILEKADSSTAYADMLGLVNMNEKNFSGEQFPPAAPSRTTPALLPESDGEEISGETQGSVQPPVSAVVSAYAGTASDENPASIPAGKASVAGDPSADLVSPTPARNHLEGRGSANTGGSHEVIHANVNTDTEGPEMGQTSLAAREGEKPLHSDFQPPAFLTKQKTIADYRPNCLNPDACGASGLNHCFRCAKAAGEVEAA